MNDKRGEMFWALFGEHGMFWSEIHMSNAPDNLGGGVSKPWIFRQRKRAIGMMREMREADPEEDIYLKRVKVTVIKPTKKRK